MLFLILYLIYVFILALFSIFIVFKIMDLSIPGDKTKFAAIAYFFYFGSILLITGIILIVKQLL